MIILLVFWLKFGLQCRKTHYRNISVYILYICRRLKRDKFNWPRTIFVQSIKSSPTIVCFHCCQFNLKFVSFCYFFAFFALLFLSFSLPFHCFGLSNITNSFSIQLEEKNLQTSLCTCDILFFCLHFVQFMQLKFTFLRGTLAFLVFPPLKGKLSTCAAPALTCFCSPAGSSFT